MEEGEKRKETETVLPGLLLCFLLAVPAYGAGRIWPLVGGPIFGILLGMTLAFWRRPGFFNRGVAFTGKKILQFAIVLLGFGMHLLVVLQVGAQSLLVMVFTLAAAFIAAFFLGKVLKIPGNGAVLIGVGTAICGGSAIAATAPVVKASDEEMAFAISTIFLFNIAAVFLFPFLGHIWGMGDFAFGMWAGTAINDTSSVVAAGYAFSDAAGRFATIVKLTRTLMILPTTVVLAFYMGRRKKSAGEYRLRNTFPWFILGFLAAAIVTTGGFLGPVFPIYLAEAGKFCIVMAMAAIGLNTHLFKLAKHGWRPLLLGLGCWFAVAAVSLATQYTLGLW